MRVWAVLEFEPENAMVKEYIPVLEQTKAMRKLSVSAAFLFRFAWTVGHLGMFVQALLSPLKATKAMLRKRNQTMTMMSMTMVMMTRLRLMKKLTKKLTKI